MKVTRLLFLSFMGILPACTQESGEEIPENLIPQNQMIPIMVDLQVLESHFQLNYGHAAGFKHALDSSSQLIFQGHGVTREQFESSFDYYAADANRIQPLYVAALDSINFALSALSEASSN